jgi:DNA-binding SARP family transcriptional activator
LDRAEGHLRSDDLDVVLSEATVAASILRRPFMPGAWAPWVDDVRRGVDDDRHRALVALAEGWARRGDHRLAALVARDAIALDPYREVAHRLLMQAEWGRGDRAAALRAFEDCRSLLERELQAGPSPETQALEQSIRAAQVTELRSEAPPPTQAGPTVSRKSTT